MKLILLSGLILCGVLASAAKPAVFDQNEKKSFKERIEKYIRDLIKPDNRQLQQYFVTLTRGMQIQEVFDPFDRFSSAAPMMTAPTYEGSEQQSHQQMQREDPGVLVVVQLAGREQPIFAIYKMNEGDRGLQKTMPVESLPLQKLVAFAYNGSRLALAEKWVDGGNGELKRDPSGLYEYLLTESQDPRISEGELVILPDYKSSKIDIETAGANTYGKLNNLITNKMNEKPWYSDLTDQNLEDMTAFHHFEVARDLDGDGKPEVITYMAEAMSLEKRKTDHPKDQFKHKSNRINIGFARAGRNFWSAECLNIGTSAGDYCSKAFTSWREAYTEQNSQIVLVATPNACGLTGKSFLVLDAPDESKVITVYGLVKYGGQDKIGADEKPLDPKTKECLLGLPNNEILSMLADHGSIRR